MGEFKALQFKLYYLPCGLDRWCSLSLLKKHIKAHIPLSLCIYREFTKKKKKLESSEQITRLHSVAICFHLFTMYFLLYVLKVVWNWFKVDFSASCADRNRDIRYLTNKGKSQDQIFRGTMATEHRNSEVWWEHGAKRAWLYGRQFVSPLVTASGTDCKPSRINT